MHRKFKSQQAGGGSGDRGGGKSKASPSSVTGSTASSSGDAGSSSSVLLKRKNKMELDVSMLGLRTEEVAYSTIPGTNPCGDNGIQGAGGSHQPAMSPEEERFVLQAIVDCNNGNDNIPGVLQIDTLASSLMCQQNMEIGIPSQDIVETSVCSVQQQQQQQMETAVAVEGIEGAFVPQPVAPNRTSNNVPIGLPPIGIPSNAEGNTASSDIPIETSMVVEVTDDAIDNVVDMAVAETVVVEKTPSFGYKSYAHNFGADAIMSEKESDVTPNATGDELDLESHNTVAVADVSMCQYTVHSGYSPKSKQAKCSPTTAARKTKSNPDSTEQSCVDNNTDVENTKPQSLLKPVNGVTSSTKGTKGKTKKSSPKKSPTTGSKKSDAAKKGKTTKTVSPSGGDSNDKIAATKPKKSVKISKETEIKTNDKANSAPSQTADTVSKHKKAKKTKSKDDSSLAVKPPKTKKAKLSDKHDATTSSVEAKPKIAKKHSPTKHSKHSSKKKIKLSVDDVFDDTSPDESIIKPKKHKSKSKSKKSSKHKSSTHHSKSIHSPSSSSASSISPGLKSPGSDKSKSSKSSDKSRTKSSSLSPSSLSGKSTSEDSHSSISNGKSPSKVKKSKSKKKSHSKGSSLLSPSSSKMSPIAMFSTDSELTSPSGEFVTNAFAEIIKSSQKNLKKSSEKSKKRKSTKSKSKSSGMLLKLAHKTGSSGKKDSKNGKKHKKSKSTKKSKKHKSKTVSPTTLLQQPGPGLLTTASVNSPTTPLHIVIPDNETQFPQRQSVTPPNDASRRNHLSNTIFGTSYQSTDMTKHRQEVDKNKSAFSKFQTTSTLHKHSIAGPSTSTSPSRSLGGGFAMKAVHVFAEPVRLLHDGNKKRPIEPIRTDGEVSKERQQHHKEQSPSPQSATTCLSEETLFSDSGIGTDNNSNPDQHVLDKHGRLRSIPSATDSVTSEMLESHPLATSAHGLYSYGKRDKLRKHMAWHYGVKKRRKRYRSYSRPHGRISPAFVFELDALVHEFRALRLDEPERSPFGFIYSQPMPLPLPKNHLSAFAKLNSNYNTYLRPSYLATVLRNNSAAQQKAVKHKSSKKKKKTKSKDKNKGENSQKISPSSSHSKVPKVSPVPMVSPVPKVSPVSKYGEAATVSMGIAQTSDHDGRTELETPKTPDGFMRIIDLIPGEKSHKKSSDKDDSPRKSPVGKSKKSGSRMKVSRMQSLLGGSISMDIKLQPIAESVKLKKRNKSIRRDDSVSSLASVSSNTPVSTKPSKKSVSLKGKKKKLSPKKVSPKSLVTTEGSLPKSADNKSTPLLVLSPSKTKQKGKGKGKSKTKSSTKKKLDSPTPVVSDSISKPDESQPEKDIAPAITSEITASAVLTPDPAQQTETSQVEESTSPPKDMSDQSSESATVSSETPTKIPTIPVKRKPQKKKTTTTKPAAKGKKKPTAATSKKSTAGKKVTKASSAEIASVHAPKDESAVSEETLKDATAEPSKDNTDEIVAVAAEDNGSENKVDAENSVEAETKSDSDNKMDVDEQRKEETTSSMDTMCEEVVKDSNVKDDESPIEEKVVDGVNRTDVSQVVPPTQTKPKGKRQKRRKTHFTPKSKASRLKAAVNKANATKSKMADAAVTSTPVDPPAQDVVVSEMDVDKTSVCISSESGAPLQDINKSEEKVDEGDEKEKELPASVEPIPPAIEVASNEPSGEKKVEDTSLVKADAVVEPQVSHQSDVKSTEVIKNTSEVSSEVIQQESVKPKPKKGRRAPAKTKAPPKAKSKLNYKAMSQAVIHSEGSDHQKGSEQLPEDKVDGRTIRGKRGATKPKVQTTKDALEQPTDSVLEQKDSLHSKPSEVEIVGEVAADQPPINTESVIKRTTQAIEDNVTAIAEKSESINVDASSVKAAVAADQGSVGADVGPSEQTPVVKPVKVVKRRKGKQDEQPAETSDVAKSRKMDDNTSCDQTDDVEIIGTVATPDESVIKTVASSTSRRQSKKPVTSAIKRQKVVNKKQGPKSKALKDSAAENVSVESSAPSDDIANMQPVVEIANCESQMAESVLEREPTTSSSTDNGSVNVPVTNSNMDYTVNSAVPMEGVTPAPHVAVAADVGSTKQLASSEQQPSKPITTKKKKAAVAAAKDGAAVAESSKPAGNMTKSVCVASGVVSPCSSMGKDESSIPLKKRKLMKLDVDINCLR